MRALRSWPGAWTGWVGKGVLAVDQEPRVDPIVDIVARMYPNRDIEFYSTSACQPTTPSVRHRVDGCMRAAENPPTPPNRVEETLEVAPAYLEEYTAESDPQDLDEVERAAEG